MQNSGRPAVRPSTDDGVSIAFVFLAVFGPALVVAGWSVLTIAAYRAFGPSNAATLVILLVTTGATLAIAAVVAGRILNGTSHAGSRLMSAIVYLVYLFGATLILGVLAMTAFHREIGGSV